MRKENSEYVKSVADDLAKYYKQDNLFEYFDDVLDVEYCVSSRREYLGIKVWVTLGGPNVWIDTRNKQVKLAWWGEVADYYLPNDVCDAIDDIFAEHWGCI